MELWLPVKGHPDYIVSNYGRVINERTGREIHQHKNRENGYFRASLDGKKYYIHRLVADTFYAGDHSGLDVNHIDGNKENNFIANLEWVTRKANIRHAFDTGLKEPSNGGWAKTVKVVRCKDCAHRNESPFCMNRPVWFYCADGICK